MSSIQDVRFRSKGSPNIELSGFLWTPRREDIAEYVCIFVHPWGILGGSSANTEPFAEILSARYGCQCLTFDLRGVGKSGGRKSLKCIAEIADVEGACDFVESNLKKDIVLIGSSAGAAIAGSCLDSSQRIKGYIGIGYTFGWISSFIFGCHYDAIMKSVKPKLFIMGSQDEFTSVGQLQSRVGEMRSALTNIVPTANHFQLETRLHAQEISEVMYKFISKIQSG